MLPSSSKSSNYSKQGNENDDDNLGPLREHCHSALNPMDSILITRLHSGRSNSVPPLPPSYTQFPLMLHSPAPLPSSQTLSLVPPSHPPMPHLPPALPPLPPSHPPLPPSRTTPSRPPHLYLPRPNSCSQIDDEPTPLDVSAHDSLPHNVIHSRSSPSPSGRWLHIPRTPSLPSPSIFSGPWHGRYSSESSPHSHSSEESTTTPLGRRSPQSGRLSEQFSREDQDDLHDSAHLQKRVDEIPLNEELTSNRPKVSTQPVPPPLTRRHTFPKCDEPGEAPDPKNVVDMCGSVESVNIGGDKSQPSMKNSSPQSPGKEILAPAFPAEGVHSLQEAVSSGRPEYVVFFLERGFSPDGETGSKSTPLILAAALGREKIVKMLLAAGADINRQDINNATALHYAAAAGCRGVVKLLLVAGADMFARTDEDLLPVELTSDSRIRYLLTCRMSSYNNLSPTALSRRHRINSDQDLYSPSDSRRESFNEEEISSFSSSSDGGLESPSRINFLAPSTSATPKLETHSEAAQASPQSTQRSSQEGSPASSTSPRGKMQHEDSTQKEQRNEGPSERQKEKKSVKFVESCEENLAYIRKDWHDAARSGCVACGKEGCGGKCLPQSKSPETKKPVQAEQRKTRSFHWTRGELLGEGAYGKVFAGLNQSTGELMAVKQLKIEPSDGQERAVYLTSLQKEIDLYKKLRHKHIVGYIDMEQDEANNSLYIFLEYVSGGSIQSMLERFGRFSEPLVRVYTRQLLLGLEYLHANRIVHRDIKGGNVLVDADGVVKLADFGASKAFHDPSITDGCKSIRGSVFWMAPEVIKGDGYGRRADIWSVGCTVIEMLTATHPWPGIDNTWTAIFHIAKACSGPPIPEEASECSKDFIHQCFQLDARLRPTASQLLTHPFVAI